MPSLCYENVVVMNDLSDHCVKAASCILAYGSWEIPAYSLVHIKHEFWIK